MTPSELREVEARVVGASVAADHSNQPADAPPSARGPAGTSNVFINADGASINLIGVNAFLQNELRVINILKQSDRERRVAIF